jgi:elongation factor G
VDLMEMKAYHFEGNSGENIKEIPVPDSVSKRCTELREQMIEKIAGYDDTLMEKYFA